MLAIAIAVVAIVAIARPATGLGAPGRLVRERPLEVGGAVATASMLGSLYYSEVADFVPCDYCWYQRIAMYPLAFILVIGAIRRDRGAMYTALPLAAIGLGIAIYHYQLQLFPEQSSSCNLFAPCTSNGSTPGDSSRSRSWQGPDSSPSRRLRYSPFVTIDAGPDPSTT